MSRFIEGEDRNQATLLPEYLDDHIAEDNPVRAVDAFVDELDLKQLGFTGADPASTDRPAYHPAVPVLYARAQLSPQKVPTPAGEYPTLHQGVGT